MTTPRTEPSTAWSREVVARLAAVLEPARDIDRARAMAAYMRDQFTFLGIASPQRRSLTRDALGDLPRPRQADLDAAARALWRLEEREYQYAACDLLVRHQRVLDTGFLPSARFLVTHKAWWDTVDALAINVIGAVVRRHRDLGDVMDRWIDDPDRWLARTAILHQMRWKTDTEPERLFAYCLRRSDDTDFFLRKAIGWALREYSKTDADAVRTFVHDHDHELSDLSQREALKWLARGESR